MRAYVLISLCLAMRLMAQTTATDEGKNLGTLTGKVTNSISGAPLANATLTLEPSYSTGESKYVANTDAEGKFLIDGVHPGTYLLSAKKSRFIEQHYGAAAPRSAGLPLTISAGQEMDDLLLKLVPQGIISGKIVDETGEPKEQVYVHLLRWSYRDGRRILERVEDESTNDLGEYRISGVSPGSYYLEAEPSEVRLQSGEVPLASHPKKPEEGYQIIYYPGTPDPSGAAALEVTPGAELNGVDVQLRKTRVFRIQGKVLDGATGQPAVNASVQLSPESPDYFAGFTDRLGGPAISGGKFEIAGVVPGAYVLLAEAEKAGQVVYAREPVQVGDANVTDLVVEIPAPISVTGRIQASGQDPETLKHLLQISKLSVMLFPAEGEGVGQFPMTAVQSDGSFVFQHIVPDRVQLGVPGLPRGWYVKSFVAGGQESRDGTVRLVNSVRLEIVVAQGTGEVTGSVVDAEDKRVPGAIVAVGPGDLDSPVRRDRFSVATTDQNGDFRMPNLVPGSYNAIAWQDSSDESGRAQEFFEAISGVCDGRKAG